MDAMSIAEKSELRTPPQRRLVKTDVPGVYRRGDRYVAITRSRGKRVKSYHRTKAKARRTAGARPTSRESFERYAGRWLVEYRGRTARGLSPSTRGAYRLIFETRLRRHASTSSTRSDEQRYSRVRRRARRRPRECRV